MLNIVYRFYFHCFIFVYPVPFSCLQYKSVLRPHFLNWWCYHVCMAVPRSPEVDTTYLVVFTWLGWVTLPTCSLNLVFRDLVVHPMYWGPLCLAHSPLPLVQLTLYTTPGVVQEMYEEIGKVSPVKLQVWVVELMEWEQVEQSILFPHLLNQAKLKPS